jgi:hypothetical protein
MLGENPPGATLSDMAYFVIEPFNHCPPELRNIRLEYCVRISCYILAVIVGGKERSW